METLSEPPSVQFYQILIVLLLVFLNGFFVATEIALVKIRQSQLDSVNNPNLLSTVNKVKYFLNNMNAFLAATQLGITLASLALGWVGESVVHQLIKQLFNSLNLGISNTIASSFSIGISFCLITVMHIVFGELTPKTIAINNPLRITLFVAFPMWLFYYVFRPLVWILNSLANLVFKIFNIKPVENTNLYYSEEELKLIISDSQEGGAIGENERELIENVFDFDECKVYSIFTPRKDVKAIEIDCSLMNALRYTIEDGHSRYPVYDKQTDDVIGIINTKDLIKKLLQSKNEQSSIADLIRKPLFISENAKIKYALKRMQQQHLQLAIITNEVGEFSGIVTFEDIVEELVGDIQDEYDNEPKVVIKESEHSYIVRAHENLAYINKYLPVKLTEDTAYDTLAGFIYHLHSEKDLQMGDTIAIDNYQGQILKMRRNSVETVRLTTTAPVLD